MAAKWALKVCEFDDRDSAVTDLMADELAGIRTPVTVSTRCGGMAAGALKKTAHTRETAPAMTATALARSNAAFTRRVNDIVQHSE